MTSPNVVQRDGAALLTGPRGRDVCARVAQLADATVSVPWERADDSASRVLLEQLRGVDAAAIAGLADPLVLLDPLGAAVDAARYWQEPEERDVLLRDPRIVTALEPVAHALAEAPAARWWWSPLDLDQQAVVRWWGRKPLRGAPIRLTGATERLERWRSETSAEEVRAARERPAAFDARHSGAWWSTPVHADITTTSRRLGPLPAVQLELVEDSMGWERARVSPVQVRPDRQVLEIGSATDWIDLVERYPLAVDRSRRHDWWRATGGTGPWQIPDWAAAGRDHDAVHLSVAGYLAGAGRSLPTESGRTVLAGFDPDLTYWLTDSLGRTAPETTWRRVEEDGAGNAWVPEGVAH